MTAHPPPKPTSFPAFGQLRELLHQPNPSNLLALAELLRPTLAAGSPALKTYLLHHLDAWPEALLEAPPAWREQIAQIPTQPTLMLVRRLNLSGCKLQPYLLERILARGQPLCLRTLALQNNPLGTRGLRALIEQEHRLPALLQLQLDQCMLGDLGLEALARSPIMGRLTHLHLQRNAIGAEGLRLLLHLLELGAQWRLRHLDLRQNRVDASLLDALRVQPCLQRCEILVTA